jgi:hypothetical protein
LIDGWGDAPEIQPIKENRAVRIRKPWLAASPDGKGALWISWNCDCRVFEQFEGLGIASSTRRVSQSHRRFSNQPAWAGAIGLVAVIGPEVPS